MDTGAIQALQPDPGDIQALQPDPGIVQAFQPDTETRQALQPDPGSVQALQPVQGMVPVSVGDMEPDINPISHINNGHCRTVFIRPGVHSSCNYFLYFFLSFIKYIEPH